MPIGHLDVPSMKGKVSAAEWSAREDLAALYRVAAHNGWQDVTLNHFTARVPDEPNHFLIKPTEMMFEEVTASSLLCISLDDRKVYPSPFDKSPASFNIHGTILKSRPDIACTMHLHTDAGAALSALDGGLMFISQYAMRFWEKVSYHTYEGLVHGDSREECETMTTQPRPQLRADHVEPRHARLPAARSARRSCSTTIWNAPRRSRSRRWPPAAR